MVGFIRDRQVAVSVGNRGLVVVRHGELALPDIEDQDRGLPDRPT